MSLTGNGNAFAKISADKFRGEAAVNLTDTIFGGDVTECLTIGNVIPGTVTGNSDTADYKDTVLADISDFISISNCGSVRITKVTSPADGTGEFGYTLERDSGDDINYAGDTSATGTLTEDGDSESVDDLIAGTDYTLAEGEVGPEYALDSIVCDDVDVTEGGTFSVAVGATTDCTITNVLQNGTLTVNKDVVNDNGGEATADDFSFEVDGGASQAFEADGSNDLTVLPRPVQRHRDPDRRLHDDRQHLRRRRRARRRLRQLHDHQR